MVNAQVKVTIQVVVSRLRHVELTARMESIAPARAVGSSQVERLCVRGGELGEHGGWRVVFSARRAFRDVVVQAPIGINEERCAVRCSG